MKTPINIHNYPTLIRGSSLFTTGGGVPYEDQINSLKKINNININLESINEFSEDDIICTVAELGPTNVPPLKKNRVIKRMRELLSKTISKQISGLYPPEIGQESVVIESAHYLNLPIADFDPVGFRAVPYIDINIFNLLQLPFSYVPMVVATDSEEIFLINKELSYKKLEDTLRKMTLLSRVGVVFILGAPLTLSKLLKNKLIRPSYSKALELGKINHLSQLMNSLNAEIVLDTRVVGKKEYIQQGFLKELIIVEDQNRKRYKLIILNEVLFIFNEDNKILASVPKRILLIDPVALRGMSAVCLKKETHVIIAVIQPEKEWKTKRAQNLFGKKRFSNLESMCNYRI